MYRFISSYLKPRYRNTKYDNVDISQMTLKELFDDYIDGWIELTHPSLSTNVYMLLNDLKQDDVPMRLDLTFNRFLGYIGDAALLTSTTKPVYKTDIVRARDALQAGYQIDMCVPYQEVSEGGVVTNKTNLYIDKPLEIDKTIADVCLVSINGFLHRAIPRVTGVEVIDGGRTWLHSKERLCSLLSFERIGKVIQIPIEAEMMERASAATPYSSAVVMKIGMDITNKSIVLSLGGYMYIDPDFLTVISAENGVFKITLSKIDIPTAILNSYDFIDLSSMGFPRYELDRAHGCVNIIKATSDIAVKKWLTLPQSFIAVVDTPALTVEYEALHKTGVYGSFEYHEEPYLPLKHPLGRLSDYWVRKLNRAWIVQTTKPEYAHRLDYTSSEEFMLNINKAIPYDAIWDHVPKFLKIRGTKRIS